MAVIAQWIQHVAPSVFVVDVSAEVTALVRLMGTPVVTIVLPGRRRDPATRLCYTLAETILAPWPASVSGILLDATARGATRSGTWARSRDSMIASRSPLPAAVSIRCSYCWAAGDPASPARTSARRRPLLPAGGGPPLGGTTGRWAEDPWTALCRADVVVRRRLNSLAAVAAARKPPAVVVPQARPHDEQLMTARALARSGLRIVARPWPQAARWSGLLSAAAELGGDRWADFVFPGTGAQAAAEVIQSVAVRTTGPGIRCAAPS